MIVVADASPLNYLILIDAVDCLKSLYEVVHIPGTVLDELTAPGTPGSVQRWASTPPVWIITSQPNHPHPIPSLDAGDAAAIALALELSADAVLIDERRGRAVATNLGLRVFGTLAILDEAGRRNLLQVHTCVEKLLQTNFRCSESLIRHLLAKHPPATDH